MSALQFSLCYHMVDALSNISQSIRKYEVIRNIRSSRKHLAYGCGWCCCWYLGDSRNLGRVCQKTITSELQNLTPSSIESLHWTEVPMKSQRPYILNKFVIRVGVAIDISNWYFEELVNRAPINLSCLFVSLSQAWLDYHVFLLIIRIHSSPTLGHE